MAYGGWGGFNTGFPGYPSPFGDPGFGPPGGMLPPFLPPEAMESKDSFERGGEKNEKEESHGVSGFVKGMANGAVNMVKGMFSPQGLVMTAGVGALAWMTGGAILPVVGLIGLGTGAYQFMNGIGKGSAEAAGEGFFDLAFGMLGFAGPKSLQLGGEEFTLQGGKAGEVAQDAGLLEKMKAPFGLSKYRNAAGDEELNLWQLSGRKLQERFDGWFGNSSESTMARSATGDRYVSTQRPRGNSAITLKDFHSDLTEMGFRKKSFEKLKIQLEGLEKKDQLTPEEGAIWQSTMKEIVKPHETDYRNFMREFNTLRIKKQQASNWLSQLFNPKWKAEVQRLEEKQWELVHKMKTSQEANVRHLLSKGIDVRPYLPESFQESGKPVNQFKTAVTAESGIANTEASEETVAAMAKKINATTAQRSLMEHLHQTKKLDKNLIDKDKKLEYEALCKSLPEHAERLRDLWNLKVIKLMMEKGSEHNQFAEFYDGDIVNFEKKSTLNDLVSTWTTPVQRETELGKLKLEALTRLINSAEGKWTPALEDHIWLRKKVTQNLYNNLPESHKAFLPKPDEYLKKIESDNPEEIQAVQAYHNLLKNLHEGNGLTPEKRKEILDAFMATQDSKTNSSLPAHIQRYLELPECKEQLRQAHEDLKKDLNDIDFLNNEHGGDAYKKDLEILNKYNKILEKFKTTPLRLSPGDIKELSHIADELKSISCLEKHKAILETIQTKLKAEGLHGTEFQRAGLERLLDQDKVSSLLAARERWSEWPTDFINYIKNKVQRAVDRSKPEYADEAARKRTAENHQDHYRRLLEHEVGLADNVHHELSIENEKLFGGPKAEPEPEPTGQADEPIKVSRIKKSALTRFKEGVSKVKRGIFGGS